MFSVTFHSNQDAGAAQNKWIDLSHGFDADTIYPPQAKKFQLETVMEGVNAAGNYYAAYNYSAAEHGGTHMDAPVHFSQGDQSIDQVPLSRLMGPGAVIDVSGKALADPDYQISITDIQTWEEKYGTIPTGAILLFNLGYYQFWPDAVKYMGTDMRGPEAFPHLSFPGIHPDAAQWLATQRHINAVGLDAISVDFGRSKSCHSHRAFLQNKIPIFENVTNLNQLPATGSFIIALPMKIIGGSGAPLRIIAQVP